jgi:ribonuclease P protein component
LSQENIFSKDYRLLKSNDFKDLYNLRPLISKHILFFYKIDESLNNMKVGITASRQVGNSVNRNYIKRLVREWYRKSQLKLIPCKLNILIRPVISKNKDFNSKDFVADFVRELDFLSKKLIDTRINK